ncbi:MAG: stage III sporulation protein AE [Syntrophomonadaceae bacterium]|nr:stage III sporulation protein AE [Syntrophomonadaceae bacterium]
MLKKAAGLLWVFLVLFSSQPAYAAQSENAAEAFSWPEALEQLDVSALEEYKNNIERELDFKLNKTSVTQWLKDFVSGDWSFDFKSLGENLGGFFLREVKVNASLLGKLILLSVVTALLMNLQTSFSSSVARISHWVCFLAISALALGSFKVAFALAADTIDNMVAFMMGMLPQMLLLTAALGNFNSSVILFPLLMSSTTAFAAAIKNIVFPLIIMSAIMSIVNHLSDSLKVERLGRFFRQAAQLSLSLFVTVFVGVITLQAVYVSSLDKITLRTTKFVTDNAIPVVGKMFSDTIEVAAGYVAMLKQGLGVVGVFIILGLILYPLLKIAAVAFIYKISGAIVEPMGNAKTAAVLESMSSHLFLILSAMAAIGLMFMVMIALLVGMANGFSALR